MRCRTNNEQVNTNNIDAILFPLYYNFLTACFSKCIYRMTFWLLTAKLITKVQPEDYHVMLHRIEIPLYYTELLQTF